MNDATNPREAIGGNKPPLARMIVAEENLAATVQAFLDDEYAQVPTTVSALLDEARELPKVIADDAEMGIFARLIKRLRDEAAKIEAFRVKEKEPYYRGAQAVDAFFMALKEKCVRKDSKAKPGAADVLQARLDAYNQRKLQEEQERRRAEALRLAAEAEARRQEEEEARQKAERDRLAADRARAPLAVEVKTGIAEDSEQAASVAKVDATLAALAAEGAHVATLAKPADMVRTRVDQGPTVTMATEAYAAIEDEALLDRDALWPFIALEAKEKALRAWAKTTGHNVKMAGAAIGRRPKTVVR